MCPESGRQFLLFLEQDYVGRVVSEQDGNRHSPDILDFDPEQVNEVAKWLRCARSRLPPEQRYQMGLRSPPGFLAALRVVSLFRGTLVLLRHGSG
jgi:hypothetical protein